MKKLLLFFCLYFLYDINYIDSDMYFYYEDKINYKLNLINTNSKELALALKEVDLNVYSYIIDDKKYYARNINELESVFTEDLKLEDKIYYLNNGINIDSIIVNAEDSQIDKLRKIVPIY